MWRTIETDSADALWRDALHLLQSAPDSARQLGRTGSTREVLHVGFTLRDPRQRWIFSRRPALNPAFALAEVIWIVRGRRDARFLSFFNRSLQKFAGNATALHGAYGYRLRKHFGFDQLERAYETLANNPSSRQVVLQLWDARDDLPDMQGKPRDPDIPCNTQSFLKIRNGRLEWMQLMRSNDIHLGLPHNLVQFTALQEIMAGWLGLEPGHYHHMSDSLHLYERDATVTAGESVAFRSTESLTLPKAESDIAFTHLEGAVERIIDERSSAVDLPREASLALLPPAYENILRVLLAEGLRRRSALRLAEEVMGRCTNESYQQLWSNWVRRVADGASRSATDTVS